MESKKVLAVLEDLFFTVKINEAAKRAGLPITFVKSEQDVLEQAKTQRIDLTAQVATQSKEIREKLNFEILMMILCNRVRQLGTNWHR